MSDLIVAIGLVLVIEGALYALFPGGMQRMMQQMQAVAPSSLRTTGLVAAAIGLVIVWLVRG